MSITSYDFTIEGIAPIGFGAVFQSEPDAGENNDAFDARCWKERAHMDEDGALHLPELAIKKGLESYAAYKGEKIKGKGSKTWTQKYQRGVMEEGLAYIFRGTERLNDTALKMKKLFVPADGKPGGSKRVFRRFPYLPAGWSAEGVLIVTEPDITKDHLEDYLAGAGLYVGVGFWRPERRGLWGRFKVTRLEKK